MSKKDVNHAVYKLGFFAAKRRMMREIRWRFAHLGCIDQLNLKKMFQKVQP